MQITVHSSAAVVDTPMLLVGVEVPPTADLETTKRTVERKNRSQRNGYIVSWTRLCNRVAANKFRWRLAYFGSRMPHDWR